MISARRFEILLLAAITAATCAHGQSPPLVKNEAEQLQKRFQLLRIKYLDRKEAGYDLQKVNPLVLETLAARDAKNWQLLVRLMDRLEPALAALTPPPGTPEPAAIASRGTSRKIGDFSFGLEYARPGIAKLYTDIGANWIRIGPVPWWIVEPKPPQGGKPQYDWTRLDRFVAEYQAAGFENAQMLVTCKSNWATVRSASKQFAVQKGDSGERGLGDGPEVATPPKPEYWNHYAKFISSIVERYDADGRDDMPGLKFPVRLIEIETECQHEAYWQGTIDEYGQLLQTAYRAAKSANPQTKIVLCGLNLGDMFDDAPDTALVAGRIKRLGPKLQQWFRNIEKLLTFHESFDAVEFHYNFAPKGCYGTVEWIRTQMRKNGYEKPIWAGDAGIGPMFEDFVFNHRFAKFESDEIYQALKDPGNSNHAETTAWYQSEQAANVVKRLTLALHTGMAGVNIGNLDDWRDYWGGRNWAFQGLRDPKGQARPAWHAYKLTVEKVRGAQQIERLDSPENVFAYRLTRPQGDVFVLWCDAGNEEFRLALQSKRAAVTPVATSTLMSAAAAKARDTQNGKLTLSLTPNPLFVESVSD